MRLVFDVSGMMCTNCSRTVSRAMSRIQGISSYTVCLLTEKLIVEADNLDPQIIVDRVEAVGFDATYIEEFNINDGELTLKVNTSGFEEAIQEELNILEGIMSYEISGEEIQLKFIPDEISAKQIFLTLARITKQTPSLNTKNESGLDIMDSSRKTTSNFLRQFLLSSVITIPIVILTMVLPKFGLVDALVDYKIIGNLPVFNLILWILGTIVQFCFGKKFYMGSYQALKNGNANMDVIVALGTSSAYGLGLIMNIMYIAGFEAQRSSHYIESADSFQTSAVLISIILLGKYLESKSKMQTTSAIAKLAQLQISDANIVVDEEEFSIPCELLEVGDMVRVYPGSTIPVDGVVSEGQGQVDEAMMTGEADSVRKIIGCGVFGGTHLVTGSILIKVEKLGKDSAISQIIQLVQTVADKKAPIQKYADVISGIFVPIIVTVAIITWVTWFFLVYNRPQSLEVLFQEEGEPEYIFAFKFGISVMVIACPCALGLATPTAVMVATGVAAKYGIFIKSGDTLERASKINTIVFDKTGTLTSGQPQVTDFRLQSTMFKDDLIWDIVLAAESSSEHPIGKSICDSRESTATAKIEQFMNYPGEGISAEISIEGKKYVVLAGNEKIFEREGIAIDLETEQDLANFSEQGKTVIIVSIDSQTIGTIALQDVNLVRDEAAEVVSHLQSKGYKIWMITGDNEQCAQAVANAVGIENYAASCYPQEKRALVEQLQMPLQKDNEMNLMENASIAMSPKPLISNNLAKKTNKKYDLMMSEEQTESKPTTNGVLFIGDGINDSPSLVQADIGIAIGGTDIAMEAANIVLMKPDLKDVIVALDLAKTALRRIKINFFWAFIYNVTLIPLAAGVFYIWLGWRLAPIFAGTAMALSSITVVLSSLCLKTYRAPTFKDNTNEQATADTTNRKYKNFS